MGKVGQQCAAVSFVIVAIVATSVEMASVRHPFLKEGNMQPTMGHVTQVFHGSGLIEINIKWFKCNVFRRFYSP